MPVRQPFIVDQFIMNSEFLLNLAQVLGHTVWYETVREWPGDAKCGGDPRAPTANESTRAMLAAYTQNLPGLINATLPFTTPMAQAQQNAEAVVAPQRAQLQADIYNQNAPGMAQTARDISTADRTATAGTDLSILKGAGADAARTAYGLSQEFDPEFYSTRSATSGSIADLLKGGLTPGEEEAIQRSLNRSNTNTGNIDVPSATATVSNAMQFGNAARQRQLQGVQAATSFLPVSRTNFDPTQIALGRPSINTGEAKFAGVQNDPNQATAFGQGVLGNIAGFQNTAMGVNANRRDSLDRVNETMSSLPT